MLDYVSQEQAQNRQVAAGRDTQRKASKQLLFKDQDAIVREKAKLIAGNYKVEALKKRLQLLKCRNKEQQQICNIYNKGKTPP